MLIGISLWHYLKVPQGTHENWQVVEFFYEDISPSTKKMVEASSEDSVLDMTLEEAIQFLEFLADTSRK